MITQYNRILLDPLSAGGGPVSDMAAADTTTQAAVVTTSAESSGGDNQQAALDQQQQTNPHVPPSDDRDVHAKLPDLDWSKTKVDLGDFKTNRNRFGEGTEPTKPAVVATPPAQEVPVQEVQEEVPTQDATQAPTAPARTVDPILEAYPEAAPFIKQMSKQAREYVTARLNESLKLRADIVERDKALELASKGRTKVPDSYYDNPSAFVLLPEYQQAVQDTSLAQQVKSHWVRQQVALTNGKEWRPADIKYNPTTKQHELVQGAPQAYSEQALEYVAENLDHASNQFRELDKERMEIERGFNQNVKQRIGRIQQAESELFPVERWDATKDTAEGKMLKVVDEGLQQLGISKSNPAYNLLLKTGAALVLERQWRTAQVGKTQQQSAIAADTRRAGPTGNMTSGGGGGAVAGANEEVTLDMFKAYTQGSRRL